MKVGDTVWYHDDNSRHWKPFPGGAVVRDHEAEFKEWVIIGETRNCWIVAPFADGKGWKLRKVNGCDWSIVLMGGDSHRFALTRHAVDDWCYVEENRRRISSAVLDMSADTLRKVAAIVDAVKP